METDRVATLFQRSLEKYNLVYKTFIDDADSKSYVAVSSAWPYGTNMFITKEECASHITERMDRRLRVVVRKYKSIYFDSIVDCCSKVELLFLK